MRLLVTGGTGVLGRAFGPLAEARARGAGPGPGRTRPVRPGRRGRGRARRGRGAAPGHAHPAAGQDGAARGVARERPAARRGLGHLGRRGAGRRGQGVRPADGHVRLPGRPAGVGADAGRGTSRSSCAPRWPPSTRPPGSPRPGGAASCCASGFSTGRAPATTSRTRPWAPRCTLRTPAARCSPRSTVPSGVYNVCRDGERVSNRRFAQATGWHPQR